MSWASLSQERVRPSRHPTGNAPSETSLWWIPQALRLTRLVRVVDQWLLRHCAPTEPSWTWYHLSPDSVWEWEWAGHVWTYSEYHSCWVSAGYWWDGLTPPDAKQTWQLAQLKVAGEVTPGNTRCIARAR